MKTQALERFLREWNSSQLPIASLLLCFLFLVLCSGGGGEIPTRQSCVRWNPDEKTAAAVGFHAALQTAVKTITIADFVGKLTVSVMSGN